MSQRSKSVQVIRKGAEPVPGETKSRQGLGREVWKVLTQERPTFEMIFEKLLPSLLTLAIAVLATSALFFRAADGWPTVVATALVAAFFYVMTVLLWRTPKASVWLAVVLMPWLFVAALVLLGAAKAWQLLSARRLEKGTRTGTVLNLAQKQAKRRNKV